MSAGTGAGDDDSSISSYSSSQAPSQPYRTQLPALAPRDSSDAPTRKRSSASGSSRPPRLSHRSRAGCWTCRGRKVKCDEVHPRCGPCQRLNRECDWDLRWNFSDATTSTQGKYKNVSTTGNAVWDPRARRPSATPSPLGRHFDHLPPFATLTNDEERERKAETQLPGTYSVVVTPESFSGLPEYIPLTSPTGRRMSTQSFRASSVGSPANSLHRTTSLRDPNVIVLDRFEDALGSSGTALSPPLSQLRRPSMPDAIDRLSLSSPATAAMSRFNAPLPGQVGGTDDPLIAHFRRHIVPRLIQPLLDVGGPDLLTPGSTRDVFEIEATRFSPLYHAICAVSALNLSYQGRSSLEEALQHYHQALSSAATPTTPDDLLSDSLFLRHFLLFLYDICAPLSFKDGDANMWAQHLDRLSQIAVQRHLRLGRAPRHKYLMWMLCQLDMHSCLLGSGHCTFLATVMSHDMLPTPDEQLPDLGFTIEQHTAGSRILPGEEQTFPAILQLNQGLVIHTAKMAQVAQTFRSEAAALAGRPTPVATYARWQSAINQIQNDILSHWNELYPDFLPRESSQAVLHLPPRVRYVYEHAFMLFQAAMIYSRTSMFPGQRRDPFYNQPPMIADIELRCNAILAMATSLLNTIPTTMDPGPRTQKRHLVFPVFLAGVATAQPDAKIRAIDLVQSMEGTHVPAAAGLVASAMTGIAGAIPGGIGQNTHRTRQLLVDVCEEQRRAGRIENVEWVQVARERGLQVANCGF